jgi:nodulation protein E
MGVVAAVGKDVAEFTASLRAGRSGIRPIALVDRARLRFENGAEVPDYRPEDHFDSRTITLLDRFTQFAALAARQAVSDSGLAPGSGLLRRAAIVTGTCVGGQTSEDQGFADLYLHGKPRLNPLLIPRVMANAGASHISLEFGILGPVFSVSSACSSANHAIGIACGMIRCGMVETAIAGGSEAMFSLGILKAWEALRIVSTDTCRPFSRDRRGLILGEGGAMLVLETLESARARGAQIHAEIVGVGMSSDAFHLTQPSVDGPAAAISAALEDAGLAPEQIGYINAHGTGTAANDPVETAAVRKVFGAHADRLAISSTKSVHGHALGAAGAIEAVATIVALRDGFFPPTANYLGPDPDCDLDVVPNQARDARAEYALSNSFAFGGLNAVLAFRSSASL